MNALAPPLLRQDDDTLVVDRAGEFRVDGSIYTSPRIFQEEMDRVFGKTWVFVAHDSEIPAPGDFKTAYIGARPVIVSRDKEGRIHVLLNRCRHRAAAVSRDLSGNTTHFTCKYHGWSYRSDGSLMTMAMHRGGYPDDIDKSAMGLMPAARVDSYRGLIFASMAAEGPTLREHLGPALPYIDRQFDCSPTGKIAVRRGAHRTVYRGNWKFQAENSTDGYHGNFVHQSFWKLMSRFGNEGGQHGNYVELDIAKIFQRREQGRTVGFRGGHGLLQYPAPETGIASLRTGPHADYARAMEASYTPARLDEIMPQHNLWIFPNLGILLDQIRVVQPLAPDLTEVDLYFYDLDGVSDAYNQARFDGYERFFGPASFGSPDDVEMFAINQTGLGAGEVKWLELGRGLGRQQPDGDDGLAGHPSDETPQRAFHRQWAAMMSEQQ